MLERYNYKHVFYTVFYTGQIGSRRLLIPICEVSLTCLDVFLQC